MAIFGALDFHAGAQGRLTLSAAFSAFSPPRSRPTPAAASFPARPTIRRRISSGLNRPASGADPGTRINPNDPIVKSGNLHHGDTHSIREILLPPDCPLLRPGGRGFNFCVVRTDRTPAVAADFLGGTPVVLPTEVPITFGHGGGGFGGDGMGTSNLAPLIVNGQINPALARHNIAVIKDTHGKTSHLSAADIEALSLYLKSLE